MPPNLPSTISPRKVEKSIGCLHTAVALLYTLTHSSVGWFVFPLSAAHNTKIILLVIYQTFVEQDSSDVIRRGRTAMLPSLCEAFLAKRYLLHTHAGTRSARANYDSSRQVAPPCCPACATCFSPSVIFFTHTRGN